MVLRKTVEFYRRDADDLNRFAVHIYGALKDPSVTAKASLPVSVAEHGVDMLDAKIRIAGFDQPALKPRRFAIPPSIGCK